MKSEAQHLNREWLQQKYEVEGLSTYDIGKIVGRNPKRIHEKLKHFGIPTRPRGENLKGIDNFMARPGATNPFAGSRHTDVTRKRLSEKASVPKPYLRGARNGMYGRTGDLNPRYVDGSSPERQRLYASGMWKELVRTIYARDEYRCKRCDAPHQTQSRLCAHHIRPWAGNPELRSDLTNLVTLCAKCHRWVHSRKNIHREWLS